jgi:preprotein translocase subunit SecG
MGMDFWFNLTISLHVLVAIAIIGLVLLQHGKGADMGSGFGGGSSTGLFGASGSANFLSRTTSVLAAVFFTTSLGLAYFATQKPKAAGSVIDAVKIEKPATKVPDAPAKDAPKSDAKAKDVPN